MTRESGERQTQRLVREASRAKEGSPTYALEVMIGDNAATELRCYGRVVAQYPHMELSRLETVFLVQHK